ncbi:MAG: cbb3-type cytochrome c oxidase subunit 3 [Hyphomicrobiaceae bacterium]
MTYATVAAFSQITTLFLFIAMFIAVLVYALWPANGKVFDDVQRSALDLEPVKAANETTKGASK